MRYDVDRVNVSIFPADGETGSQIEWVRLVILPRIEQFMRVVEAVESDTKLRFPKFRAYSHELKTLSAEYYVTQIRAIRDFLPCVFRLLRFDRSLVAEITKYDHEVWKWAAQQENRDRAKLIFSRDLPAEMKYRTTFSGNSVTIFKFDLLIRARYYIKYGFPELGLAPLGPNMDFAISELLTKSHKYIHSGSWTLDFQSLTIDQTALQAVRGSGFRVQNEPSVSWYTDSYVSTLSMREVLHIISAMYRMGPVAKEFLNVTEVYSLNEMISTNFEVYNFLKLFPNEINALTTIGVTERYKLNKLFASWAVNDKGDLFPATQALTRYMISPWIGSWGDANFWDDYPEHRSVRPRSLVPFEKSIESFRAYLQERQSTSRHIFTEQLKAPSENEKLMRKFIELDIVPRRAASAALRMAPGIEFIHKTDKVIDLPGYNMDYIRDLDNALGVYQTLIDLLPSFESK